MSLTPENRFITPETMTERFSILESDALNREIFAALINATIQVTIEEFSNVVRLEGAKLQAIHKRSYDRMYIKGVRK